MLHATLARPRTGRAGNRTSRARQLAPLPVVGPATGAAQLVTEVSLFLPALEPYLELLEDSGIEVDLPRRFGTENTCPG